MGNIMAMPSVVVWLWQGALNFEEQALPKSSSSGMLLLQSVHSAGRSKHPATCRSPSKALLGGVPWSTALVMPLATAMLLSSEETSFPTPCVPDSESGNVSTGSPGNSSSSSVKSMLSSIPMSGVRSGSGA